MTTATHPRQRCIEARETLLAHDRVAAVTLTSPGVDPLDRWTLELTLHDPDASSAPALAPGVLQSLVEHGLAVHDHQPRAPGESRALVVLAR